jgi:hypothetical protein
VRFEAGAGGFLCSKEFIPPSRTAQSPSQSAQGAPFKDVKRQWRDAEHSPSSSDEVESKWSCNLHPTVCLHSVHMDSSTA